MIDRRRFFQLAAAMAALTTTQAERELEEPEPEEVELHPSGTTSASGFWQPR